MTNSGAIRLEDLGEPVQRLLQSLRNGYTEEDVALLGHASVKEMAKIHAEMSSDRHAEEIWAELRAALNARREAAAVAGVEKEGEEKKQTAEKIRKRRGADEREPQGTQEAPQAEQAGPRAAKFSLQRLAWEEYVADHPLEFAGGACQHIEQKHVEHTLKAPPQVSQNLLNRTYTPKCPNCGLKFMSPPKEWNCPVCLRRLRQYIKVWQPDDSSNECMICRQQIRRFFRHHCRGCGRLICVSCSLAKAVIPTLGFDTPQRVCSDCACQNRQHGKNHGNTAQNHLSQ